MNNYCRNCGSKLEEGASACPKCGSKVLEERLNRVDIDNKNKEIEDIKKMEKKLIINILVTFFVSSLIKSLLGTYVSSLAALIVGIVTFIYLTILIVGHRVKYPNSHSARLIFSIYIFLVIIYGLNIFFILFFCMGVGPFV